MPNKWQQKVAEKVWPNVAQHEASMGRMANFALGSLYGSGIPTRDIVRRALQVRSGSENTNKELVSASIAAMRFLGDNFNKYLGTLRSEDFIERPSRTGSEPSPILLEALTHEDPKFNGGIKYPETLDLLEKNGVISKADFFKIANLQAVCDEKITARAQELASAQDVEQRSRIRDEMVEMNCDSVGTLLCAFAHIFRPNSAVSDTENLTLDTLRAEYPMQFEVGRSWQYSYGTLACVARIIRDQRDTPEPDPVIAELERNGAYTPEFIEELYDCMAKQGDKASVPMKALPEVLQNAIETVAGKARQKIEDMPGAGRIRKAIYNSINALNSEVSVCNAHGRHYFAAQQGGTGQSR